MFSYMNKHLRKQLDPSYRKECSHKMENRRVAEWFINYINGYKSYIENEEDKNNINRLLCKINGVCVEDDSYVATQMKVLEIILDNLKNTNKDKFNKLKFDVRRTLSPFEHSKILKEFICKYRL